MWRNSFLYYEQDGKYYDIFTDEFVGTEQTKSTDNKD